MIYVFVIFSFILESIISNIVPINSFLIPAFVITTLVLLYPYFKNKYNFIIATIISGLLYDIIFTNSSFVNLLSFLFSGLIIIACYHYAHYNIYSSLFINLITIIFYRIISYLLLCIIDYLKFNENIFISGIYNSILINIVYGIFMFLIINSIAKIFNLKRVE